MNDPTPDTRPLLIVGVAADVDPETLDLMNLHADGLLSDYRVLVVAGFTAAALVDRHAGTVSAVRSIDAADLAQLEG